MIIKITSTRGIDLKDLVLRSEVRAAKAAEGTLKTYIRRSCYDFAGWVDGEVACVWGLIAPSVLSDSAYLWLLTTNICSRHSFCFIRQSQIQVNEMLARFPRIRGHVIANNASGIRWLRWLGAKFNEKSNTLIEFELRAHG